MCLIKIQVWGFRYSEKKLLRMSGTQINRCYWPRGHRSTCWFCKMNPNVNHGSFNTEYSDGR